jgi:hypothetical protein
VGSLQPLQKRNGILALTRRKITKFQLNMVGNKNK